MDTEDHIIGELKQVLVNNKLQQWHKTLKVHYVVSGANGSLL